MKKKSIISLIACGALALTATLGATACNSNGGNSITVWVAADELPTLNKMLDSFREANPDFGVEIKTGIGGSGDALSNVSTDPTVAADVYCYANDQLVDLINYQALSPIPEATVAKLKEENYLNAVMSGEHNGEYYGYPYAADNGYFLYYNKAVVSDTQAQTLEGILQACYNAGKYFIYNMEEAWYVGAFFLGTGENCVGGTYTIEYEGTTVSKSYTNFSEKAAGQTDTEYTIAQVGAQAMIDLVATYKADCFTSGDDDTISQYLNGDKSGTQFGACISGTWNAKTIQEHLGDNYAAAKLPTFHSSLTNKDYQMGSLAGFKLFGVNPNTKYTAKSHQLAAYLTSEAMQELRFTELQTGPSNKNAAEKQEVKDNVAQAAIAAQAPYATLQGCYTDSYWNPMKQLGADIYGEKEIKGSVTMSSMLAKLELFVNNFKVGVD
ncbi:MAG: extracellular solute-binding protein [Clostridia bacterium]|nr:extracellular solute-binding protein [Clostridia bacterium]